MTSENSHSSALAALITNLTLTFNRLMRTKLPPSARRRRAIFVAFAAFICLAAAQNISAATYTVTTVADSGAGSLRLAVTQANGTVAADTIEFNIPAVSCPAGVCTITLTSQITFAAAVTGGALTINGTGAKNLIIDGGPGANRIFSSTNANVTLGGVTLTGGGSIGGGNLDGAAMRVSGGTFTMDGVLVTGNVAAAGGGGGIYFLNGGNIVIRNSTISNNSAGGCGGIVNSLSTMSISNTTISGNSAQSGSAGAICSDGALTMRSVTVSGNSAATDGGGIQRNNGGSLNIGNSIVAGNTASVNPDISFTAGTITSAGYNLIGDNSSVAAIFPAGNPNANNDIAGTSAAPVDPMLNALADNGGQTPTRLPMTGSPVRDKGNAFALTLDQRGFNRPYDDLSITNANGGDGSDIGAVEVPGPTAAGVSIAGRVILPEDLGLLGANVTLTAMNGATQTVRTGKGGRFIFRDVAANQTYILTVASKRYAFAPQIVTPNEDLTNVNFMTKE